MNGIAAERQGSVHAQIAEGRAFGDSDLALNQVESGDLFGHGVFDLESGVGLNEGEVVVGVGVDEELERAEIRVAAGGGEFDRRVGDSLTQLFAEGRRGSDLDEFLVAALDRALSLADVGHVAVLVADDLDLDVSSTGDEAFDEEGAVAEGGLRFAGAALEGLFDFFGFVNRAHAASTASADCLDHHRSAVKLFEEVAGSVEVDSVIGAGEDGDVAGAGERPGSGFVTEQRERGG